MTRAWPASGALGLAPGAHYGHGDPLFGHGVPISLANRFTHCDSIRDLDRNRITIGRIDSNRFEVVIHSDFVVNQNLYHHALTLGA